MLAAFLASLYFSGKGGSKWFSEENDGHSDNDVSEKELFCKLKNITIAEFNKNQSLWNPKYLAWRNMPNPSDKDFLKFIHRNNITYTTAKNDWIRTWKPRYESYLGTSLLDMDKGQPEEIATSKKFQDFMKYKKITIDEFKLDPQHWKEKYKIWLKNNLK